MYLVILKTIFTYQNDKDQRRNKSFKWLLFCKTAGIGKSRGPVSVATFIKLSVLFLPSYHTVIWDVVASSRQKAKLLSKRYMSQEIAVNLWIFKDNSKCMKKEWSEERQTQILLIINLCRFMLFPIPFMCHRPTFLKDCIDRLKSYYSFF